MIRCQINYYSTYIICFHHSIKNSNKYFSLTIFQLKDMELILDKTLDIEETNRIDQIKLAKSYDDKFFVCFLNGGILSCFINDISLNFYEWEKLHG